MNETIEKQSKTYLSVIEIAKLLSVGRDMVVAWIHQGMLQAVNVAGKTDRQSRWRVKVEHLEAFLESRRSPAPATPEPKPSRRKVNNGHTKYFPE